MSKPEDKITVRGYSGKQFRSKVVLKGKKGEPADIIKALPSNESETAKKVCKRDKDFKKLSEETKTLFKDLLGNAKFRAMIRQMFARKEFVRRGNVGCWELLHHQGFKASFAATDPATEENLIILEGNLAKLSRLYSFSLNLKKKEDGSISIEEIYGIPIHESFKMEGQSLERIVSVERDVAFFKRAVKYQCLFNEIEIEDETRPDNGRTLKMIDPLFEILSLSSNVSPTILKYARPDGFKKMLVCLPADLDMTTVTKKYGALFSKVHRDFYKKDFKGRPQGTRVLMVQLIREIWENEFKGKRHPIAILCQKLSDRLGKKHGYDRKASTIRKHYLPKIVKGESGL